MEILKRLELLVDITMFLVKYMWIPALILCAVFGYIYLRYGLEKLEESIEKVETFAKGLEKASKPKVDGNVDLFINYYVLILKVCFYSTLNRIKSFSKKY